MRSVKGIVNNIVVFLLAVYLIGCSSALERKHKTYIVEIKQMKFEPAALTVQKEDTIVFVNHDIVAHDVTDSTGAWRSSPMPRDSSWKVVVKKSSNYYCSIHPVMKGQLQVE